MPTLRAILHKIVDKLPDEWLKPHYENMLNDLTFSQRHNYSLRVKDFEALRNKLKTELESESQTERLRGKCNRLLGMVAASDLTRLYNELLSAAAWSRAKVKSDSLDLMQIPLSTQLLAEAMDEIEKELSDHE